jgi:hypothetical protein
MEEENKHEANKLKTIKQLINITKSKRHKADINETRRQFIY